MGGGIDSAYILPGSLNVHAIPGGIEAIRKTGSLKQQFISPLAARAQTDHEADGGLLHCILPSVRPQPIQTVGDFFQGKFTEQDQIGLREEIFQGTFDPEEDCTLATEGSEQGRSKRNICQRNESFTQNVVEPARKLS
jgi:hypothetical protein